MPQPALSTSQLYNLMARHGVTGPLARVMVAAALAESEGVPDLVGDGGHSIGLFQLHDQGLGAGLTVQQRADPEFATEIMKPFFAAAWDEGRQRGLTDGVLATFTYMHAERPRGFPDLNSPAANRFLGKWQALPPADGPSDGGAPARSIGVGATVAVNTRDGLRLRTEPGLDAPIVLTMPMGTLGQVVDGPRAADGFTWWKLRVDGANGWAAGAFLSVRGGSPAATGNIAVGASVAVTAEDGLRLRAGPGLDNPVLKLMALGDQARVIGGPQPADGFTWWRLDVDDLLGWAAGEFLARVAPRDPNGAGRLDPRVLELRQWIALDAPIKNGPDHRSADAYNAVIDQFGVDRNPRYAPHDGLTFCNIFVSDVTRAMLAPIPHRINPATGNPDDGGRELTCGGMIAWLLSHGSDFGWRRAPDGAAAQSAANLGQPAVVITPAGVTHDEEHTAVIRPGVCDPQLGPTLAQAGRLCLSRVEFGRIFGSRPVTFWVHE